MKSTKAQQALQRIREVAARDTGRSLSEAGIAEIEAVLKGLNGQGQAYASQEFLNREVTILLADLRGFTAIAASHPAGIVIQTNTKIQLFVQLLIFTNLS